MKKSSTKMVTRLLVGVLLVLLSFLFGRFSERYGWDSNTPAVEAQEEDAITSDAFAEEEHEKLVREAEEAAERVTKILDEELDKLLAIGGEGDESASELPLDEEVTETTSQELLRANDDLAGLALAEVPKFHDFDDEVLIRFADIDTVGWKSLEITLEDLVEGHLHFLLLYDGGDGSVPDTPEVLRALAEFLEGTAAELEGEPGPEPEPEGTEEESADLLEGQKEFELNSRVIEVAEEMAETVDQESDDDKEDGE